LASAADWHVLDDGHVLQEADGASPGHPSYRRYHYGYGPLSVVDSAGKRFIQTDALGSPTDLTSTSGAIASIRKYDAWGSYRDATAPSSADEKLGYTGHQYDPETGLVYARARYYDPEVGRFISRDTFEGWLEDSPSLHRYVYGNGNPLRFYDPTGLCAEGQDEGCELGALDWLHAALASAVSTHDYNWWRAELMDRNANQAAADAASNEATPQKEVTEDPEAPGTLAQAEDAVGKAASRLKQWWDGTALGDAVSGLDDAGRRKARELGEKVGDGLPGGPNARREELLEQTGAGAPTYYADKKELLGDIAEYEYERARDSLATGVVAGVVGATRGASPLARTEAKSVAREERATVRRTVAEDSAATKAARQRGVRAAQRQERALVESGHPGTVEGGWEWAERRRIAEEGQYPADTRWHHINDVKRHPDVAGEAKNVIPARGGTAGHVKRYHPDGTRAGSSGEMLDRESMIRRQYGEGE
jgi:RHS repeat-associated protein